MGLGLYERIGHMHNEITQVGLVCVYLYTWSLAIVNSEMVKISTGAGAVQVFPGRIVRRATMLAISQIISQLRWRSSFLSQPNSLRAKLCQTDSQLLIPNSESKNMLHSNASLIRIKRNFRCEEMCVFGDGNRRRKRTDGAEGETRCRLEGGRWLPGGYSSFKYQDFGSSIHYSMLYCTIKEGSLCTTGEERRRAETLKLTEDDVQRIVQ